MGRRVSFTISKDAANFYSEHFGSIAKGAIYAIEFIAMHQRKPGSWLARNRGVKPCNQSKSTTVTPELRDCVIEKMQVGGNAYHPEATQILNYFPAAYEEAKKGFLKTLSLKMCSVLVESCSTCFPKNPELLGTAIDARIRQRALPGTASEGLYKLYKNLGYFEAAALEIYGHSLIRETTTASADPLTMKTVSPRVIKATSDFYNAFNSSGNAAITNTLESFPSMCVDAITNLISKNVITEHLVNTASAMMKNVDMESGCAAGETLIGLVEYAPANILHIDDLSVQQLKRALKSMSMFERYCFELLLTDKKQSLLFELLHRYSPSANDVSQTAS